MPSDEVLAPVELNVKLLLISKRQIFFSVYFIALRRENWKEHGKINALH